MKTTYIILLMSVWSTFLINSKTKQSGNIKYVTETYFSFEGGKLQEVNSNEFMITGTMYNTMNNPFRGSIFEGRREVNYKFSIDGKLQSMEMISSDGNIELYTYEYKNHKLLKINQNNKVRFYCYDREIDDQRFVEFSMAGSRGIKDKFIFTKINDIHPTYCLTDKNGIILHDYDSSSRILNVTTSEFKAKFFYNEHNDIVKMRNYFGNDIDITYQYDLNNNWTKKIIKSSDNMYVVKRRIEYHNDLNVNVKKPKPIPIAVVQTKPIFPGCESSNNENCMIDRISKFLNGKFDETIPKNLGLKGRVIILAQFTIDKSGKIIDIQARNPHKEIQNEAIRVISSLPRMTSGYQNNEKVNVICSFPIVLNLD